MTHVWSNYSGITKGADMHSLIAYLPQDRLRSLARGEPLPNRTSGAALFADISGFTPLTDALTEALGSHRGVETVTDQINAVYDTLLAHVERYHGSVISFAGDAIICWFDDTDGPAAPRAVAGALAMQAAMASFAAITLPGGATTALSI